jgi:D-inositol-3-phosphate glycosyltransferase
MISLHTSPLLQPGQGDAGGMNVYVRELVSGLAQVGITCFTYTRRTRADQPTEVIVEPGHIVVHIDAGAFDLPKEDLPAIIPAFTDGVRRHIESIGGVDVVHANYWLSGLAGHRLKHRLGVPLVMTFHTFAKVKTQGGDPEPQWRIQAEEEIIGCCDAICVSCTAEQSQFLQLYGNPPGRLEIVAPGVEHAFFAPGTKSGARRALGLGNDPTMLFVGRIQPLKGLDVAIRALALLPQRDTRLVVVGGASGTEGNAEIDRIRRLATELGVSDRVRFVEPQQHHVLSTYYRAADVVIVPSRSESFGLVALEAAACGIPVVASGVGGLLTLVDHGDSGFLVPGRQPEVFAAYVSRLLHDKRLAERMAERSFQRAARYTWKHAALELKSLYADLTIGSLVECMA